MRIILFIIMILGIVNNGFSQIKWLKLTSDSLAEVEDVEMTPDGTVYLMLNEKNYYYKSKDFGLNWELFHPHENAYFGTVYSRKLFPMKNDSLLIYYGSGNGSGYWDRSYGYLDQSKKWKVCPNTNTFGFTFSRLLYDSEDRLYGIAASDIYRIDSSYDIDKVAYIQSFEYKIVNSFFYAAESNFISTLGSSGKLRIYKIDLMNSDTSLYSSIENKNIKYGHQIHINKNGDIFIAVGYAMLFAQHDHPDVFSQYPVDRNIQLENISRIEHDLQDDLYLFTDKGVYFSKEDGLQWMRLYRFSQNLPEVSAIKKMDIQDSTHAVIMLAQDCYPTRVYVLNESQSRWSDALKWIDSKAIKNTFSIDKNGLILANLDFCIHNNTKISRDDGYSYEDFKIGDELIKDFSYNRQWQTYAFSLSNKMYCSDNDYNRFTLMKSMPWLDEASLVLSGFYTLGKDRLFIVINKKYQSGSSVIYLSEDNGASWTRQCDYCFFGAEDYAYRMMNHGQIAAYTPWKDSTWVSKDFGKTWEYNPILSKLRKYTLEQLPNDDILISGVYNRNPGFYRINMKNEISLVSPLFEDNYGYHNSFHYPTIIAALDPFGKHAISQDGGVSWNELVDRIPMDNYDLALAGLDFFAENGVYYRAIRNDGLYRTTKPLVNTQDIDSKSEKNLEDFLVLSQHQLRFVEPEKLVYFAIYDISGKELLHKNSDFNKAVDLSKLPAGFYILEFNNGENFSFKYFTSGE